MYPCISFPVFIKRSYATMTRRSHREPLDVNHDQMTVSYSSLPHRVTVNKWRVCDLSKQRTALPIGTRERAAGVLSSHQYILQIMLLNCLIKRELVNCKDPHVTARLTDA